MLSSPDALGAYPVVKQRTNSPELVIGALTQLRVRISDEPARPHALLSQLHAAGVIQREYRDCCPACWRYTIQGGDHGKQSDPPTGLAGGER